VASVISINVGLPQTVTFQGRQVTTGIFKQPVKGPLRLTKLNLEGDRQADLTVHGGFDKAVYAYAAEHYEYWKKRLPDRKLSWGMFGENLTTKGLVEDSVNIGDIFRIGTAELAVTQPRMPCYKLGVKFGSMNFVRQFMESRLTGIYFKVLKEGEMQAGDLIEIVRRDKNNVKVADIVRLAAGDSEIDPEMLRRAIRIEALAEGWGQQIRKILESSEEDEGKRTGSLGEF